MPGSALGYLPEMGRHTAPKSGVLSARQAPVGSVAQRTSAKAPSLLHALDGAGRASVGFGQGQASRPIAGAGGGLQGRCLGMGCAPRSSTR